MSEEIINYDHYIPMVAEDSTWTNSVECHLIKTMDELKEVYESNKEKKYIAFDTETTGLNADVDKIVGFSIAFNSKEGWYIPIRHIIGTNVNPKEALDLLYDMLKNRFMTFMYNMRFDSRMMEKEGYNMSVVPTYDVQVGVFCSDTNWKKTGLKLAERRWLGWSADTFTETLGENENFSYLDPEEAYFYACVDSIGTFGVAEKTIKFYKESGVAGRVLNEVQYPFMKCEDIKFRIDRDYLQSCQLEVIEQLKTYEHEIYAEVGYQFKINSNKQLGDALQSLGINTNAYTKGGQMKVDIPTLELVNRELKSPLISKLIEYSQLFKQYNSYILSLIKQGEENDWKLRFHYMLCSVPTGRVASGQDRKNAYFANLNVMAIPKPHPKMYYVHDYKEGDELKDGDFVILDWRFSSVDKSEWVTEGQDQHLNMRSAFLPHEGHYIVAMDYCIDPETEVETREGKIKLRELDGREVEIKTPDGYKKAKNFHYTGKKQKCKLKLKDGREVICSPDHKFKVIRDGEEMWVELRDMRKTDYVITD